MVEELILTAWERSVSPRGKLLTVFSPLLPSPSEHLNPDARRCFSTALWKKLVKVSHEIRQCLDGLLFAYDCRKANSCKHLQESPGLVWGEASGWPVPSSAKAWQAVRGEVLPLSETFCQSRSRCKPHRFCCASPGCHPPVAGLPGTLPDGKTKERGN